METKIIELIGPGPHIHWGLPIVQDIFFTGISTGAFVLAALVYGFNNRRLAPLGRLALIVSLVSLLAALLNLIADLHQPGRFASLFWRMHATSPMTWGLFLLNAFLLLLAVQLFFVLRADFRGQARSEGDHRVVRLLALIGLPLALLVHAYSGYILGVVKAIPLWHSSILPLVFLAAALVSGLALMILLAGLLLRNQQGELPGDLLDSLSVLLAWALAANLVLRLFWYTIGMAYSTGPAREAALLLFGPSFSTATIVEITLGLVVPLIVMSLAPLRRLRPLFFGAALAATVGVWFFRWQLVMAGQLLPKTGAGFSHYEPSFWGSTGIMHVLGNFAFWILLMIVLTWILPWQEPQSSHDHALRTKGA
ncbi:MAG: NrfD/PsrC family molybdoenzyme membrane anchor subunit [Desulfurivibrionaceae bacterium]|nr:NrfD/PsrC family molybdoenzyme membrane anchor subunit [Desulfurivibrionaceae bacterium]